MAFVTNSRCSSEAVEGKRQHHSSVCRCCAVPRLAVFKAKLLRRPRSILVLENRITTAAAGLGRLSFVAHARTPHRHRFGLRKRQEIQILTLKNGPANVYNADSGKSCVLSRLPSARSDLPISHRSQIGLTTPRPRRSLISHSCCRWRTKALVCLLDLVLVTFLEGGECCLYHVQSRRTWRNQLDGVAEVGHLVRLGTVNFTSTLSSTCIQPKNSYRKMFGCDTDVDSIFA